jgi:phospholipase C
VKQRNLLLAALAVIAGSACEVHGAGLGDIDTIVVLYAENRSFDNLYGSFPGANGLSQLTPAEYMQRDRDGSVLKELPPVWDGLTAKGVVPAVTQAQTEHLANAPFAIDDPKGFNLPFGVTTRDCGIASTRTRCRSPAARTIALLPMPMRARW